MSDDELRAALAAAQDYTDLLVTCADASHAESIVKVATLRLGSDGYVDLVIPHRNDRYQRPIVRPWEGAPGGYGAEVSPNAAPARIDLIGPDGVVIERPTSDDRARPGVHWHYEMECLLCGIKLSCRKQTLDGYVVKLLDNDIVEIGLARLACATGG